jgi:hypothetical protein
MRRHILFVSTACLLTASPADATDVDGPNDCARLLVDDGDAPEGVLAYPGVPGNFPTCTAAGAVSTQTSVCAPVSTAPGATGYVLHVQFVGDPYTPHYWLGCYGTPAAPFGIDTDSDGKVNSPAVGASACAAIGTDCVEAAFGTTFDQDECLGDGSDAGIRSPLVFGTCSLAVVPFETWNCGPGHFAFLNICVDWNADGDWNDNVDCPGGCAYEWAIVNHPMFIPGGCASFTSPSFPSGPDPGPAWLRISLSDAPMPTDYPWNGTAGLGGGAVLGGETEDYPAVVSSAVGVGPSTWGGVKRAYR